MREILFRAKRLDNGEWVEGYYQKRKDVFENDEYLIFRRESYHTWEYAEVDPETICQYTGLTDKNGNKIWENDVVVFEDVGEDGYEYKEGYDFNNTARVVFEHGRWELTDFADENSAVMEDILNHDELFSLWKYTEVIGNIFDNPELLENK